MCTAREARDCRDSDATRAARVVPHDHGSYPQLAAAPATPSTGAIGHDDTRYFSTVWLQVQAHKNTCVREPLLRCLGTAGRASCTWPGYLALAVEQRHASVPVWPPVLTAAFRHIACNCCRLVCSSLGLEPRALTFPVLPLTTRPQYRQNVNVVERLSGHRYLAIYLHA